MQLSAFIFLFCLFSKHTKCVLTSPFSNQGRLRLTRKMPCSRVDLQNAHSMWLHGIRSGPSVSKCLLNDYINSPCHHDICLCSCIALQSVLKQRMGNKSPYAFVPPAQIRIVLTLKTRHSGWTLSQSTGYRVYPNPWKKLKQCTRNDINGCALAFNFPYSGRLCDLPHHPPKNQQMPPQLSIHHSDANASPFSSYPTAIDLVRHYSQCTTRCSSSQPHTFGTNLLIYLTNSEQNSTFGCAPPQLLLHSVDKGAESQPWHEYHHATIYPESRPKGRWKKIGVRRTDQGKSRMMSGGPDHSHTKR